MPSRPRGSLTVLTLLMLMANLAHAADRGETVAELSPRTWVVFQARNNDYWFGSDGQGAYRYDGKMIVRFTTRDGLSGDRVREFQEDASGRIFIGTLTGISAFDGKAFATLTPVESREWRIHPDDLWFKGDSMVDGPYRFDGKTLHHLKFPRSDLEDAYRKGNPNPPASPYGVYTIYRDRAGSLWFGTAAFGLCRYDGKGFGWLYERDLTDTPAGGSFGIRSIMEDGRGCFWINNTGHRFTISPGPGPVRYTKAPGVPQPAVPGSENPAWFNGIARQNGAAGRGDLWMSTFGQGAWRYDSETLTHYPVRDGEKDARGVSISTDNRGQIWLGTLDSGAFRLEGKAFRKFRP